MYLINWLNLQPTNTDIQRAIQGLGDIVHIRTLLQSLVRTVLTTYPWEDRVDLAPVFDPSKSYQEGGIVAIPQKDEQGLRPDTWRLGIVVTTDNGENPIQGAFQVVRLSVGDRAHIYAAEIPNAHALPIVFNVENEIDLDWLVSDIVGAYQKQLTAVLTEAVEEGHIQGAISDDEILLGEISDLCGEEEGKFLVDIFGKLLPDIHFLTTDQLLSELRELGCLIDVADDIAYFSLEALLNDYGFQDLGGGRWITPERLDELDRDVNRRMSVPVIQSKVAKEIGEDDRADFEVYEEAELETEAQVALAEMGEEESETTAEGTPDRWQPPSTPIQLPTINYLHIMEGFFPLAKRLARAFNPQEDPTLVEIQVIEGEYLQFLINREEGIVKALDVEAFRRRFLEAGIPAGTKLWLEYQNSFKYRIAPHPLPEPRSVKCKLAYIKNGRLVIDEIEIEVAFETDTSIFKAELRFEDLEALFTEAEQSGLSIFDAIWFTFEELSRKNPDVRLHHTEVFNAVFFKHRMCSPRSVITELYSRPCFVPVGDGYFKFEPERGIKRYQVRKIAKVIQTPKSTLASKPQRRIEISGYFIFQQRPDSEYSDRIGTIYNWRQGIPGSNQIKEGARFIYYRPGEKVFFGTGHIERIDSYQGEDGHTYFNGYIEDYEEWRPPLGLDRDLAQQLSFYKPGRIWIGQAGIRTITEKDFNTISQIYEFSASDTSARVKSNSTQGAQKESQKRIYPPDDESDVDTSSTRLERTRTGQLVATDIIPQGPLFEKRQEQETPEPVDEIREEVSGSQKQEDADQVGGEEKRRAGDEKQATDEEQVLGSQEKSQPHRASSPPSARHAGLGKQKSTSKSLFSQHYIENRIQEYPEWEEEIWEAFDELRTLYQSLQERLPGMNEAQTEAEFIRPVLKRLGFAYIVQTSVSGTGRVLRPDYSLFANEETKVEADQYRENETAFYARALAIADAKQWGQELSRRGSDNRNPSFQIVNYLIGTGVDWGILTNGGQWRLYYRRAPSTATEFYEVDLIELLEGDDVEAFKYFWLFFRCQAFEKDIHGLNFLERIREKSVTYARKVGDRLNELVYEQVFPQLAGGFVAYSAERGLERADKSASKEVYQATLSFLYKLLFLLYAEARYLLPMDNPGYLSRSLTRMSGEIAKRLDRQEPLGYTSTSFYDSLLDLFHMIDLGDRGLDLPRYNGGLFHFDFSDSADQKQYAANWYLHNHKIPDAFLAPALDRLVRIDGQNIDYSYLQVRHLGAIYEGLLEYKLIIDDATKGSVHLETDKGQRKATGSYYTPDYIVEYIVSYTLDPILDERGQRFDDLMREIGEIRKRLANPRSLDEIPTLRQDLERYRHKASQTLLDIKVCDPAMGSGHFLVEAVDFLTDRLIEILNKHPEDNPVLNMLERIRGNIIENMQQQGIPIAEVRLDDTQLLQRVVMKRCIYGVDLNPMAVELAKVSLWLHSFTVGAPLSFLDHHLRQGNSLIGVWDIGHFIAQGSDRWNEVVRALTNMVMISELTDSTASEVTESYRLYEIAQEDINPVVERLNVALATYFTDLGDVSRAAMLAYRSKSDRGVYPKELEKFKMAQRIANEKGFFHWKLEFPEVFIDLERATWKENPGFDAVVGNPPYGASFTNEKKYIKSNFITHQMDYDSYIYFQEQSINLLKIDGIQSFIMPNMWLTLEKNEYLRRFILSSCEIVSLLDTASVFEDASVETAILIAKKRINQNREGAFRIGSPIEAMTSVRLLSKDKSISERLLMLGNRKWETTYSRHQIEWWNNEYARIDYYLSEMGSQIVDKVKSQSIDLDIIADISQGLTAYDKYRGHTPEMIRQRVFHANHQKDDTYRKFLQGSDVGRYELNWSGEWISYGEWLGAPRDPKYFRLPRLLFREVTGGANRPLATFTTEELYYGHSVIPAVTNDDKFDSMYLTAIVNSQLIAWVNIQISPNARKGTFPKMNPSDVASLPIRDISFTTQPDARKKFFSHAQTLYQHGFPLVSNNKKTFADLLIFVDYHLSYKPVRADVIHDLLAYLAEMMIVMNNEKQSEVKGFLNWFEREVGVSIDKLTNKTKIRGYLGDFQKNEDFLAFDDLLDILRQNRRYLEIDPSDRGFQDRLMQGYQASLKKLLPHKERLAVTDRLIDLVVYRLYGLTKEEIAIVEGDRSDPPNPT